MPAAAPSADPALRVQQDFMFFTGQLNRQWRRLVDRRLRPHGLTEATWLPLVHLWRAREPMRQKDLAASLALDSSSVVRLLDGLEAGGFIVRAGHADRRAKAIELTAQGLSTVEALHAVLWESRLALFGAVAPDDLERAFSVLQCLGQRLADMERDDPTEREEREDSAA